MKCRFSFAWIGSILLALVVSPIASPAPASANEAEASPIDFEQQIQPILQARCVACHGDEEQSAELSLATAEDLLRGGESGSVIVAGSPTESLLYERVHRREMPPEDSEPLTDAEIELLRRWIAEGASLGQSVKHEETVTDERIVPLMLLRCATCHGERRREADLDLRTPEGMLRGGKSGPAVVKGAPGASLLIQRIRSEEMPPRRQLVAASVKPMEASELKLLEQWIAAGMPSAEPRDERSSAVSSVKDEDREFWSFRSPQAAPLPVEQLSPDDLQRVRSPVDVFVMAKLREQGLTLSPEANRETLIRRLYFDLIGLPPTAEQVNQFVNDPHPQAYEMLVESLLASPHYGERWGRHWLDAAGYADSEGGDNEDRVRPNMWRYRDYVIQSLNRDKPYDRFLMEQIAGDELVDYENAGTITQEIYDNLVATGFLRTAPDRTFANITNFVPDRLEVIADEIQILGSAVLGLTIQCSRCHSHKFDPLPQRDYYRLAALLKDALDEHDWLGPQERQLPYVTTDERRAWEEHEAHLRSQIEPLQQQLDASTDEEEKKEIQKRIEELKAQQRPEPKIRALWSRGVPSPTYLLRRGNYLTPGERVTPGVPEVLTRRGGELVIEPPWPGAATTGRRLALARWLTQPDHPLTARVMVNRVWKQHFGQGLVATPDNFGNTGARPTHPELLDWLAVEFVRRGWSLKALHRELVTSSTYRQSSQVTPEALAADPDNRWLSRMPLRRLEAEVLRDALLSVAGRLDLTPYGPPDGVDVRGDGLVTVQASDHGERRSIYVLHRRTQMPTILENFDSPQMSPNCIVRSESIAAPQALHLLNNAVVYELAGHFADRIWADVGMDRDAQITLAFELAFGTGPDGEQRQIAEEMLGRLDAEWRETIGEEEDAEQQAARRALRNFCHALMNSAAFVYVD